MPRSFRPHMWSKGRIAAYYKEAQNLILNPCADARARWQGRGSGIRRGTWNMTIEGPAGSPQLTGKYRRLEKQRDGSWKVNADIGNSDLPPVDPQERRLEVEFRAFSGDRADFVLAKATSSLPAEAGSFWPPAAAFRSHRCVSPESSKGAHCAAFQCNAGEVLHVPFCAGQGSPFRKTWPSSPAPILNRLSPAATRWKTPTAWFWHCLVQTYLARGAGGVSPVTPAWSNRNLMQLAPVIESPMILCHVRAATPGIGADTSCHPLCGPLRLHANGRPVQVSPSAPHPHQPPVESRKSIEGTTVEHIFALFLITSWHRRNSVGHSPGGGLVTAIRKSLELAEISNAEPHFLNIAV